VPPEVDLMLWYIIGAVWVTVSIVVGVLLGNWLAGVEQRAHDASERPW